MDNHKRKHRKHSVLTFIVIVFIVSAIFTFVFCLYVGLARKMIEIKEEYSDKARTVASIINDIYNAKTDNKTLTSSADYPPLSERQKKVLSSLCRNFDFQYLYLFSLDEEKSEYTYIFVVSSDDELNKLVEEKRPYGTVIKVDDIPDAVLAAAHGNTEDALWIDDTEFGKTYCWAYPIGTISDSDAHFIVAAEFDVEKINRSVMRRTLYISLPIISILLLNLVILLIIIRKNILKPIKLISQKMNSFAESSDISGEKLNISKNDEIGEIADSFDKMTDDIGRYIENINKLTSYQVQASTQMEIAERIQYGIVPEKTEISKKSFNAYASEKPARLIGGDFYECFMLDGHELCLAAGDVSGKGITAALFMVMVKTSIREKLISGSSPAEVLNAVNDEVCSSNPEGMFATVFLAVMDVDTGLVCYANAGHNAPVIIGNDKTRLFRPDPGIAVGLFEDADIKNGSLILQPDSGMLLYTDGVTEAVNTDNELYGEKRLLKALKGTKDSCEAVNTLKGSVNDFYSGREQFDDITILSAFFKGTENRLVLKADLDEQDRINELIRAEASGSMKWKNIILACEEIFTNIVSYSGASETVFYCGRDGEELYAEFIDNGKPFDPVNTEIKEKDFEALDTGGMGISLVKKIASEIKYKRAGDFNCLKMVFSL